MSRSWGIALLVACADVFAATLWPGPINGLTVLVIFGVDAVLLLALIAVPKVIAANRCQAHILAQFPEDTAAVAARRQFIADINRFERAVTHDAVVRWGG